MTPVRMTILGVALVAGVGSVALLARGMAASQEKPRPVIVAAAPAAQPTVRVLVARHDLAVGDKIGPADMNWQAWPAEALNPAFITDGPAKTSPTQNNLINAASKAADAAKASLANPADGAGAQMVGAMVRDPILAGEPLVQSKVVHAGAAGVMAVTLDPGMRAMALPLSAESAAGGFILPGDHVDVVLSRQADAPGGGHIFSTSTVMKNVRVLAVDQNTGVQKSNAVVGATATVEVSPSQAELLVLAKAQGSLTLVLRSYADAAGPAVSGGITNHAGQDADLVVKVFRNGAPTPVTVSR